MTIVKVIEHLFDKNIVIFGTGENAEQFYYRNKDLLNIRYFTSNWNQETEFCGLKRIEPIELNNIKNVYIVVCASQYGSCVIESQLSMRFSYISEFCDLEIFEQMLKGRKKLILITGLCHQQLLFEGLKYVKSIQQKYILVFYWYGDIKANVLVKKKVYELSKYADYAVSLKTKPNESYDYLSSAVNNIIFPLPYMQALYPQIVWGQGIGNTYLENPILKRKLGKRTEDARVFRYTDKNVVKLLQQGFSDERVVEEICRKDFYTSEDLSSEYNKMVHQNKNADVRTDIALADYILSNFTKRRMFLDGEHFSNELAWKVIADLVNKIDNNVKILETDKVDLIHVLAKKDAAWEYECPIYPCVREYFKLEWADENTKYKYVNLYNTKELGFEEFMLQYTRYIRYALNIGNCWKDAERIIVSKF